MAFCALMKINSDTDKLLRELDSGEAVERMYALAALAMSDESFVDEELQRGLADADRDCRATAARMLGERHARTAAPALVRTLLDSSSDVAQEAAEALGKLGEVQAVEPLLTVLREHSAPARAAAARALGSLGDVRAVDGLAAALSDTTEGVRAEAAESLGELAAQGAVPALVGALGDSSDRVRQSAVSALRRLGTPSVNALVEELRSPTDARRWRAAWALGECAAPEAAEPLLRALQDGSENVRAQAALSLGTIGARRATESLERAMSDASPSVREAATLALARLGHAPPPGAAVRGDADVRYPPDGSGLTRTHPAAHLDVRERPRRTPRRRFRLPLSALLIALAVLLVIAVWATGEALRLRAARRAARPAGIGTVKPYTPPPVPKTPDGPANGSTADCQVVNPSFYVEGDTLIVRGQVVNEGVGTAKNVGVRITVLDAYDEVVARWDVDASPQEIAPNHSATYKLTMPLPPITSRPTMKVVARWD
jgi:HEAT repeat protein